MKREVASGFTLQGISIVSLVDVFETMRRGRCPAPVPARIRIRFPFSASAAKPEGASLLTNFASVTDSESNAVGAVRMINASPDATPAAAGSGVTVNTPVVLL